MSGNRIATAGLAMAMAANGALGPGLFEIESTSKACLEYELPKRGISVKRREPVPIDNRDRANCWLASARSKRFTAEYAGVSRRSRIPETVSSANPPRPLR